MGSKRTAAVLFCAVCLVFSTCLLVLGLLCGIRTTEVNDRAAGLEREIAALKTENEILRAACENSISLEELERIATEELGMQRCTPEQIYIIELPG